MDMVWLGEPFIENFFRLEPWFHSPSIGRAGNPRVLSSRAANP